MPINKALYPSNWAAISHHIRFDRAKNRCEWCGIENGLLIIRSEIQPARYIVFCPETGGTMWPDGELIWASEEPEEFAWAESYTKVVLTVAHLDRNPANNDEINLAALCQRCHLNYDRPVNVVTRKKNRINRQHQRVIEAGQLEFCLLSVS